MEHKHDFLELFGKIEEDMIAEAAEPWNQHSSHKWISGRWMQVACAALIGVLALCVIFPEQTRAAFQTVANYIGEVFHIQEDYTTRINQYTTKNNLTITVDEATMGVDELDVAWHMKNETAEENPIVFSEAWINGEKIETEGGGAYSSEENWEEDDRQVANFPFDGSKITGDTVDVKVIFQHMDPSILENPVEPKIVNEYEFQFKLNRRKLLDNTVQINTNQEIAIIDQETMKLTHFVANDLESDIRGVCKDLPAENEYYIIGKDSQGNEVYYRNQWYENPNIVFRQMKQESSLSPEASYVELQLYEGVIDPEDEDVFIESVYDSDDTDETYPKENTETSESPTPTPTSAQKTTSHTLISQKNLTKFQEEQNLKSLKPVGEPFTIQMN